MAIPQFCHMHYHKWKATRLFNGENWLPADSVVITDAEGKIQDIIRSSEAGEEVKEYEGILLPGLINCHCHLELSHMRNVIPPHTGLVEFLCSVVSKRDFDRDLILEAIRKADEEMFENGIVAVGDIGNTADTLETKKHSRIRWMNFVEVLSFFDENADARMEHYSQIREQFLRELPLPHITNLVPHAPYTISPKTFRLISEAGPGAVLSVHNQENPAEDELYRTGEGELLKLFQLLGIPASPFPVTRTSSVRSYLPYFGNGQTLLLVHNTFMPADDVTYANQYATSAGMNLFYCLCPNANLYIENRMPPVKQFMEANGQIVLGTDSYSSNWQLSIASEIKSIHDHFPELPLEQILQWATLNGARALGWSNDLGSIEIGKTPGLVLLSNDLNSVKRII